MSKLPGTLPPEIEVLTDAAVKDAFAAAPYGVALDEVLAPVEDHHDYVAAIAKALMLDESVVAPSPAARTPAHGSPATSRAWCPSSATDCTTAADPAPVGWSRARVGARRVAENMPCGEPPDCPHERPGR
jgi:hypothetical protein